MPPHTMLLHVVASLGSGSSWPSSRLRFPECASRGLLNLQESLRNAEPWTNECMHACIILCMQIC